MQLCCNIELTDTAYSCYLCGLLILIPLVNNIYDKILDRDWFSVRLFVT